MQQDHSLEFAYTDECLRAEEEDLEERDKRDNLVTVMNESPFLRFLVLTDGQTAVCVLGRPILGLVAHSSPHVSLSASPGR
jgi:hypothetical protein